MNLFWRSLFPILPPEDARPWRNKNPYEYWNTSGLNWDISTYDEALLTHAVRLCVRMEEDGRSIDRHYRSELKVSLAVAHLNGCPLNFKELLEFDATDLYVDVFGIRENICHQTGQLLNGFVPKCAAANFEGAA